MSKLLACGVAISLTACATPVPTGTLAHSHMDMDGKWTCIYLGTEGEGYAYVHTAHECKEFTYEQID